MQPPLLVFSIIIDDFMQDHLLFPFTWGTALKYRKKETVAQKIIESGRLGKPLHVVPRTEGRFNLG